MDEFGRLLLKGNFLFLLSFKLFLEIMRLPSLLLVFDMVLKLGRVES